MKLLVAHGADPNVPDHASRRAVRARVTAVARTSQDVSGLPPVPVGGPGVTPLQAAAGVGYGEGFAANSHRYAPGGMLRGREVSGRGDSARTSTPPITKATPRCTTPPRAATSR